MFGPAGDSFTVHNDKDFERDILTANYRHGKFSSFQRQLNMYGFRKVADCSDRTYSHPNFLRNRPELLSQVRRVVAGTVVSSNADENDGNSVKVDGSKKRSPASASREDDEDEEAEYGSHTTGESDGDNTSNGNNGDETRSPARKRTRCGPDVRHGKYSGPSSALSGGIDGRAYGGIGIFPHPLQQWGDSSANSSTAAANGGGISAAAAITQKQQQRQQQVLARAQSQAMSRQQFTSSWHQHTGLWGGVSNGVEDAWTSTSSSAASSVEATSPVLLPINHADLDSSDHIPPFRLQSNISHHSAAQNNNNDMPALVSPAGSVGRLGSAADWRGSASFNAMDVMPDTSMARPPSMAGLHRGSWSSGGGSAVMKGASSSAALAAGGGGSTRGGKIDENPLSLDKAFDFGEALARCPSYELIFDAEDLVMCTSNGRSNNNTVPVSPTGSAADGAKGTVASTILSSAAPKQTEIAALNVPSIGWDLEGLAGAGWGSPDTKDSSAAAKPWEALPPLGRSRSSLAFRDGEEEESVAASDLASGGALKADKDGNPVSPVATAAAAAVVEGIRDGVSRNTQQQQQESHFHHRSLSTLSAFSLSAVDPAPGGVDPLDWALFDEGGASADALGLEDSTSVFSATSGGFEAAENATGRVASVFPFSSGGLSYGATEVDPHMMSDGDPAGAAAAGRRDDGWGVGAPAARSNIRWSEHGAA